MSGGSVAMSVFVCLIFLGIQIYLVHFVSSSDLLLLPSYRVLGSCVKTLGFNLAMLYENDMFGVLSSQP